MTSYNKLEMTNYLILNWFASFNLASYRKKLNVRGNHGMTCTAKLKVLLLMMFLQTLNSVGVRQLIGGNFLVGTENPLLNHFCTIMIRFPGKKKVKTGIFRFDVTTILLLMKFNAFFCVYFWIFVDKNKFW